MSISLLLIVLCLGCLFMAVWGAAKSNVVMVGVSAAVLSLVVVLMLAGVR